MSNEAMNKKMEHIVERQVQYAEHIETMREVQTEHANQLRTLSNAVITVVGVVGSLTEVQGRAGVRMNLLTEAQTRTDEKIQLLTEAQTRTDERLNISINVVERNIRGNRGAENHA